MTNINNDYEQVYGKEYTDRMTFLKDEILKVGGSEKIAVIDTEAGLGKSLTVNQTIDDCLYDLEGEKMFLVVKKFSTDVDKFVKFLEHHNSSFERLPRVLGLTSENFQNWRHRLSDLKYIPAIAMTHARYMMACEDDELRESLINNRNVLIIDEKLDFPVYTYNKETFDRFRSYYPYELQKEVDKVCNKLNDILYNLRLDGKYNSVVKVGKVNIHPKTLENFIKLTFADMDLIDNKYRQQVKNFLELLELMYGTKLTYFQGSLSTFNRKHRVWMIPDGVNIIMDASATIEKRLYSLSDKFEIKRQERIIDHSNSHFVFVKFNSSKTNIKNNEQEYFKEISKLIKKYRKENERVLVVLHKENRNKMRDALINEKIYSVAVGDDYEGESVAINWLNNLIGKNDYADFEHVMIVGNPNIPMQVYLQYYMQYAEKDDLGRKDLGIIQGKFNNEIFEDIKIGNVSAEIYQCLKRIQRVPKPRGKFWIVNNNLDVVSKITNELKGLNFKGDNKNVHVINFEFEEKKQEAKPKTKLDLIIEHLRSLPIGEYTKSDISQQIKIDKTNFGKYIKHRRISELKFVEVTTRKIIIHEKKDKFVPEESETIQDLFDE